jgi:hypothetical protein
MNYKEIEENLIQLGVFNRKKIKDIIIESDPKLNSNSMDYYIHRLLKKGVIVRIQRNLYTTRINDKATYSYQTQELSSKIKKSIIRKFPYIKFVVWDLVILNEFFNHQITSNIVFVETENIVTSFLFEYLTDKFGMKVLLKPSKDTLFNYLKENSIVIINLLTEAPINKSDNHIVLEKLIVDLFSNKLLKSLVSSGDYHEALVNMFNYYYIDESKLFRYARRRNVEQIVHEFIKNETNITLIKESNNA